MLTLKLPWDIGEGEEINIVKAASGQSGRKEVPFDLLAALRI